MIKTKNNTIRKKLKSELLEKISKLKREPIFKTKKMCFDDPNNPEECLYDIPPSKQGILGKCFMMVKGIPKEQCPYYDDEVIGYESFTEWNACVDKIMKIIKNF